MRRPIKAVEVVLSLKDGRGEYLKTDSVVSIFGTRSYVASVEEINGEYVFVGAGQKDVPVEKADFLIIGKKYKLEKVGV